MAKIIDLIEYQGRGRRKRKPQTDRSSVKMKHVSDRIDRLLLDCLKNHELAPYELAGLLAHRLGNLIRASENQDKEALLEVCEKVLKQQAG